MTGEELTENHRNGGQIPAPTEQSLRRGVGILGGTVTGRNFAWRYADSGYRVAFVDRTLATVQAALHDLASILNEKVRAGTLSSTRSTRVLHRIDIGSGVERLQGRDLVIVTVPTIESDPQAVAEQLQLLEAIVDRSTPICVVVNHGGEAETLAELAPDPARVVPICPILPQFEASIVQIIRGEQTSDAWVSRVQQVFENAGITAVSAPSTPGLVINRLLIALVNEACHMLQRGEATADAIDRSFRLSALHNLGPLQAADVIGIDSLFSVSEALFSETGNERYRPAPLLRAMVDSGQLGLPSGMGFYCYSPGENQSAVHE